MIVNPVPADDLRILYVDEDLVAVDKPAGLLSVPGRGPEKADCALSRLQSLYPSVLTVHRLDQPTSGILVFALNPAMQRAASVAFAERSVLKRYEAQVHGIPGSRSGRIELPLIADWPNRPRQMVDHTIGKPSRTDWEVLGSDGHDRARLSLRPLTGRSHQLRVHMAAIGHPIVGDRLYGLETEADGRLHLHAAELAFDHPRTGVRLEICSGVPF